MSCLSPALSAKSYCPQLDCGCCCICGQKQGYLCHSTDGNWAHFQCALCVDETQFNCIPTVVNSRNREHNYVHTGWDFKLGSDWLNGDPEAVCYHCSQQGRCIVCCWPDCKKQTHPACVNPGTEIFDISASGCVWLCETHSVSYSVKVGNCLGLDWLQWLNHDMNRANHSPKRMPERLTRHVSVKVTKEKNSESLQPLQSLCSSQSHSSLQSSPELEQHLSPRQPSSPPQPSSPLQPSSPPQPSSPSSPLSSSLSSLSPSLSPVPLFPDHSDNTTLKMELESAHNQPGVEHEESGSELLSTERSSRKKQSLLLLCLEKSTSVRKLILRRLKHFFGGSPFFVDSTNTLKMSVIRYLSRIDLHHVSTANREQIAKICENWDNSVIYEDIWMIITCLLELQNSPPFNSFLFLGQVEQEKKLQNRIIKEKLWTWPQFVNVARQEVKGKCPSYWSQKKRSLRRK